MEDKIKDIIGQLNALLIEGISPHTVSLTFDSIAKLMVELNVMIKPVGVIPFYNNARLQELNIYKEQLYKQGRYEEAAKTRFSIKQILMEYGDNEEAKLSYPASGFLLNDGCIEARLNERVPNEKLLLQLIEAYFYKKDEPLE